MGEIESLYIDDSHQNTFTVFVKFAAGPAFDGRGVSLPTNPVQLVDRVDHGNRRTLLRACSVDVIFAVYDDLQFAR